LARAVLGEDQGTKADDLVGRRLEGPGLGEAAFAIRLFEAVARQDVEAVEEALSGRVGFGKVEAEAVGGELGKADGLAVGREQVSLRRGEFVVLIDGEREDDVVGVEGMAVGKADSAAQVDGAGEAVGGELPTLRERGFGGEGGGVDADEAAVEQPEDVARGSVDGEYGVKVRGSARWDRTSRCGSAWVSAARARERRAFIIDGLVVRRACCWRA
jgi:hypothetical protein